MKLNELSDKSGATKDRIRVGRGVGSGKGKTGGRGVKGQKSRSGVAIKGFEGGQMPIHRRLPKRGFNNIFRIEFQTINLGDLQKFVDSGKLNGTKKIGKEDLIKAGVFKKSYLPVKILGKGKIKTALKIEVDAASATAVSAIEKAGGSISLPGKAKKEKEEA